MQELKSAFAAFIRNENEGDAAELQNGLNDAIAAARAFPQEKKLQQMADIAGQTVQKTLDQRAFAASLEQIRELLARLERETEPAHFDVIAATAANGIAALVLQKDKAAPEQLAELKAAENKREAIEQIFFNKLSKQTAEELEGEIAHMVSLAPTSTKKIEQWAAHMSKLQMRVQERKLTVHDAQRLTETANKTIAALNEERMKSYNRWALAQVDRALSRDSNSISDYGRSSILRECLGEIDPRFLDHNVQRAYGEVFSYFYSQLTTVGEKLSVDKALAQSAKKKLEDF